MFAKQPINTGRQIELDLARGLAVFFMIVIHIQLLYATVAVNESWPGTINDYLGGVPAAPMFMFLLGVGTVYSQKQTWQQLMRRGVIVFGLGYALNFIRGFLPQLVLLFSYPEYSQFYWQQALVELLTIDILQFAGLALITLGAFLRWQWRPSWQLAFVVICALSQLGLRNYPSENLGLAAIFGLFYGAAEFAYFPYFTWIFYPVTGMLFGRLLIRSQQKSQFYRIAATASLLTVTSLVVIFNLGFGLPDAMQTEALYYHHSIIDQLSFGSVIIIEIASLYYLSRHLPKWFLTLTKRWSRNVLGIFLGHWIILMWLTLFIPLNSLGYFGFFTFTSVIIICSDWLGQYLQQQLKKII